MSWIDAAERKFGRFAIPNILRIIGIFQLLVFVLMLIPDTKDVVQLISLNREKILSGEIWRAFTYVFVPRSSSPLWIIIMVMFLFFISDGLEQAWGSFRLNLYVFGTILCISGAVLLGLHPAPEVLFSSLIMAFAYHYPHTTIMLFFVIPVKMKYIGFITGGFLILMAMGGPLAAMGILAGLLPFFAVFGPKYLSFLKNQSERTARRQVYHEESALPEGEAFHTCYECGATDVANRHLEFRVAGDGEEYCVECLDKKKKVENPPG